MNELSQIQSLLDEIKERASKATPAPWRAEWNGSGVNLKVGDHMIGTMDTEWLEEDTPLISAEEIEANGELFAHSRTDIPMLVARVEALMDTLVEMETEDDIYARRSIRNAALTETLAMMKGTK